MSLALFSRAVLGVLVVWKMVVLRSRREAVEKEKSIVV